MTDADNLRTALVEELTAHKWLTTDQWQAAFDTVPRHLFLPRFFALTPDGATYEAIDDNHPEWLHMAYRNAVWPTQLDGDLTAWQRARDTGPISGEPTCSATQPSLMATMLEALDMQAGQRALEIGTGTGYNAALLAHRLGETNVTTVDVDPSLTTQARVNLDRARYSPTVVTGNGAHGHSERAPYDRLIATCSVAAVPAAWLHQVRPGGVILANLYRQLIGGSLVRLTVHDDGTASGRLLDDSGGFMPLRAHQSPAMWNLIKAASKQEGVTRESGLPEPVSDNGPAWTVLADLLMPGVARTDITRDDGAVQWLVHPDGSWAYYDMTTGDVEQHGPRQLWDELEHVYAMWAGNGKPHRDHIGVTITTTGKHHIWLHNDTNTISLNH
ncbi:MAG: ATP-grasp peptide maturase system methyltransferase [Pseudonocardiaceae bacterium]